jgi:beta-lactamase class A
LRALRRLVAKLVKRRHFPARDADLPAVERRIRGIASDIGGRVGFAAIHLESQRVVSVNGELPLPMASTVKLPVAMRVMQRIARGELASKTLVSIEARHICPGGGALAATLNIPGVSLSVENLLELALVYSDNAASDVLLELAGGPPAVADLMKEIEIHGLNIQRSIREIVVAHRGLTEDEAEEGARTGRFGTSHLAVPPERRAAAVVRFLSDPRDHTTALAMTALLAALWNGRVLDAAHSASLLDMMSRCRTGRKRLSRLLPAGTRVAHKSGTLPPTMTADVGIIYLPAPYGHLAAAAFVAGSGAPEKEQDRAIAAMARVAYDFFVTHSQ